ncbi:MAG: hypothetical protein ACRD4B_01960, partial [Acidobacteriota bacterium]
TGENIFASLYRVQVYARTHDQYFTFCTSEATKAIDDYLEDRRRCGEEPLKPTSPLFRKQYNRDDQFRINIPEFFKSEVAVMQSITEVLKKSGVNSSKEVMRSHGLRKFFISQCESSPMKSLHVSMLSGHSTGIKKNYYKAKESVVLEDYMTHAADALTIDPTQRLQKKVQDLEGQQAQEITQLKNELSEYKEDVRRRDERTRKQEEEWGKTWQRLENMIRSDKQPQQQQQQKQKQKQKQKQQKKYSWFKTDTEPNAI